MRHRVLRFAVLLLVLSATISIAADSNPTFSGFVAGRELCPQSICGAALFVAGFAGEIASEPVIGLAAAAIRHYPLPPQGQFSSIIGGRWSILTTGRVLEGDVTGGTLFNIDDVRYAVVMSMEITEGGSGTATLHAILDHGPFPPTIRGVIVQ